jgi:hypothetical protein
MHSLKMTLFMVETCRSAKEGPSVLVIYLGL